MSLHHTSSRWAAIGLACVLTVFGCSAADETKFPSRTSGTGGSETGGAGGSNPGTGGGPGGVTGGAGGGIISTPDGGADGASLPCTNLQCYQNNCKAGPCKVGPCANGGTTSVSGIIYDPAGALPLYNIIVYVPNEPLMPIATGATCEQCGTVSGRPITTALTNTKGEFKLDNVPVTSDIPLVIQIGKWRRQVTIPSVASCADTPLTDKNQTRLPRSMAEGHLPKMALTTGGADALECLLRKIGIADSEFTTEAGQGRVNFYTGTNGAPRYNMTLNGGAMFTGATTLWNSAANLRAYDIVLLSCEGTENPTNKSMAALAALQEYANVGGRVFASHWHNYWFEFGPAPWPTVGMWNHASNPPNPFTAEIDQTFPKGKALAEWLINVGSAAPLGQLIIREARHTMDASNPAVSQRWVYSNNPASTQYVSFNTPMGAPEPMQCGRVVFSDIHVSSGDTSTTRTAYPDGCTTTGLTDQEKALVFMLFDLSSCVIDDKKPPKPPIIK
jgi:hypothetical protein